MRHGSHPLLYVPAYEPELVHSFLVWLAGDVSQVDAFAKEMRLSLSERQQLDEALRTKLPSVALSPLPLSLSQQLPPLVQPRAEVDLFAMVGGDQPSTSSDWQPDEELGAGDGWDFDDVTWPSNDEDSDVLVAVDDTRAPPTAAAASTTARPMPLPAPRLPRAVTPPRRVQQQPSRVGSAQSGSGTFMRGGAR